MGLVESVSRMLRASGEPVTFSYEDGGGFNPDTGAPVPGIIKTISAYGYPGNYTSREVDGSSVLMSDTKLICERLQERPGIGWRVTIDGKSLRVMHISPIRKSGADIIYIVQCRNA